jgi:hypothetical protein
MDYDHVSDRKMVLPSYKAGWVSACSSRVRPLGLRVKTASARRIPRRAHADIRPSQLETKPPDGISRGRLGEEHQEHRCHTEQDDNGGDQLPRRKRVLVADGPAQRGRRCRRRCASRPGAARSGIGCHARSRIGCRCASAGIGYGTPDSIGCRRGPAGAGCRGSPVGLRRSRNRRRSARRGKQRPRLRGHAIRPSGGHRHRRHRRHRRSGRGGRRRHGRHGKGSRLRLGGDAVGDPAQGGHDERRVVAVRRQADRPDARARGRRVRTARGPRREQRQSRGAGQRPPPLLPFGDGASAATDVGGQDRQVWQRGAFLRGPDSVARVMRAYRELGLPEPRCVPELPQFAQEPRRVVSRRVVRRYLTELSLTVLHPSTPPIESDWSDLRPHRWDPQKPEGYISQATALRIVRMLYLDIFQYECGLRQVRALPDIQ